MNAKYEKEKLSNGYFAVIGCDEVGRGCLAGPVVAAAVILPREVESYEVHKGIKDSKLLTPKKREELSDIIKNMAVVWAIGEVAPEVVDEINIHNASLLAMEKAVLGLPGEYLPEKGNRCLIAVDGKFVLPKFNMEQEAIVDGDNKILSIAAASIVAKVYRDNLMKDLDRQYPHYSFARHKGYATEYHRKMVVEHGLSPLHRLSFCRNLGILKPR